ncbi:MAG: alkaline phosphatase family protein [Cyanobacteria bacterium P01_A01_bin.45]
MANIFSTAQKQLLSRQKLPPAFGSEAIRPSYDGLGLGNIANLPVKWLCPDAPHLIEEKGLSAFNPELLEDTTVTKTWHKWLEQAPINHVIFLILDGLGYQQLQSLIDGNDTPAIATACKSEQAFFMPATSIYPTTTVTALTSAATGYSPAQHGLVATGLYFSEIGSIVDLIRFKPKFASSPISEDIFNPDKLLSVPNIYLRMEKAGVNVEIVNFYQFKQSGISRFTTSDSVAGGDNFHGYKTVADGFTQLRQRVLAKYSEHKSFTYMYLPYIDMVSHARSPLSHSYRAETASIDFAIQRELLAPLAGRNDVVMILTADHGQRLADKEKTLWINEHPELTKLLFAPITGESRVRFLHLKHGTEDKAIAYIKKNFSSEFLVITKAEAIDLGLFGIPGKELSIEADQRVGDLLLIPHQDWICRQKMSSGEVYPGHLGIHGGLSQDEMLIPFLAYRF